MHGPMNIKFIDTKQAKELYQVKNIKRKLYITNAAIWYNQTYSRPSWPVPEAVITAVPAPGDGGQQPKHVELYTEM